MLSEHTESGNFGNIDLGRFHYLTHIVQETVKIAALLDVDPMMKETASKLNQAIAKLFLFRHTTSHLCSARFDPATPPTPCDLETA